MSWHLLVLHGFIQSSWQSPCSWNVILLLFLLMLMLMLFMELFFNFTLQKSFLKFMSFLTNERLLQYAGRVDLCFEFEGIRNSCYCFYCYLFEMCVCVFYLTFLMVFGVVGFAFEMLNIWVPVFRDRKATCHLTD